MEELPDEEVSPGLRRIIGDALAAAGGWLGFDAFMALALYAPGLGYYARDSLKFGSLPYRQQDGRAVAGSDFVTAPEISPLFGQTLASQLAQALSQTQTNTVWEFGAGSGALAQQLLSSLQALGQPLPQYRIVELSATLRARQQARLAAFAGQVQWVDTLPEQLTGVLLGNEVLDAMPVHIVRITAAGVEEAGVTQIGGAFAWDWRPAGAELRSAASELQLPQGYQTEFQLVARGFVRTLAQALARGVILLIDYGFPAREYYHGQRSEGTLMCHYRHRAHADPFFLPGLQDITSHIDFSAVARAGEETGLELLGYTGQAQFLISCGITDILLRTSPEDAAAYLPQASAAQQLLAPSEMGELFKVIAFGKDYAKPLMGFASGDRRRSL